MNNTLPPLPPSKLDVVMVKESGDLGLAFPALVLIVAVAVFLAGCSGPSKTQYAKLLHECRVSNRERVKIIKAYEAAECKTNPEQPMGALNFGEAGH